MAESVIDVQGVGKVYAPFPRWLRLLLRSSDKAAVLALDDVSLQVEAGQICAVVGPNGAGKSTLFRVLTGLTTATTGQATILGLDVARQSSAVRRVVGFMPADDRSLFLRHTCLENLIFHGRMQATPGSKLVERANETLEVVGLAHARNRVGFALSAGMRARLQLARAIFHHPSVLILDEPTGTLDPVSSYELVRIIQDLTVERNLAVMLSSHRIEDIEALHDRVLLLNHGKVVYLGNLEKLRAMWEQPRIEVTFEHDENATATALMVREVPGIEVVSVEPPHLVLGTTMGVGELLGHLNGGQGIIKSIQQARMPLRELLAKMLQRQEGQP